MVELEDLSLSTPVLNVSKAVLEILLDNGSVYGIEEVSFSQKANEDVAIIQWNELEMHCFVEPNTVVGDSVVVSNLALEKAIGKCMITHPSIPVNKVVYNIPADSWVLSRKLIDVL